MTDQAPDPLVTVRLLDLPLHVHARAQQHSEAMQREFQLIVAQGCEHADAVPARLLELSALLSRRYQSFTAQQEQRLDAAVDGGELQLGELVFTVPSHAADGVDQLSAILDEADEFCRQGALLTLATPPELVDYRRWYLDNFRVQCQGGTPRPWTGPLH